MGTRREITAAVVDLASIVEVSEKSFRPKDGGEVRSDVLDGEQHGRRRRRGNLLRGKQRVPLGLHRLDLLEQQFEADRAHG